MSTSRLPRVEVLGRPRGRPFALLLALAGGKATSTDASRRLGLAQLRVRHLASKLATAGAPHGLATWLLRYRVQGWNGSDRDPVRDTGWALERAGRTHPGLPVVLLGHSMGARAAVWAAEHHAVTGVCALAPWLEPADPVAQLVGCEVLIAHGDRDRVTDPAASYDFARRVRAAGGRACRFELPGGDHAMLRQHRAWTELARRFVLGVAGVAPPDPAVAAAFDEPAPGGLRVPMGAVGPGRSA